MYLLALLVLLFVARGVGDLAAEVGEVRLTFRDTAELVELRPPADDEAGTHLYLSHSMDKVPSWAMLTRSAS